MKKIFTLLICFLVALSFTGCGCSKKDTKEKNKKEKEVNENQTVILEDQTIDNVSFESFNVVTNDNNQTYIDFDVANNTDSAITVNKVRFTLYVKDEKLLSVVENINMTLEPGESYRILEPSDVKLYNVDRVEYTFE